MSLYAASWEASASKSAAGDVLLTLCNLNPTAAVTLECECRDLDVNKVQGTVLVGDTITAHNTFDAPERVKPQAFEGVSVDDNQHLTIQLPAASVVALTLS